MYKLSFFIALAIAAAVNAGRICYFEDVVGKACSHFISAYDMTGVATEYDLSIVNDDIKSACDCIKACKKNSTTCNSWVYKFTDNSGHRTCTLYSNFITPPLVDIKFDVGASTNILPLQTINNPENGSLVPHCTVDGTPTGKADPYCKSGFFLSLDNGKFLC